ncbi:MAG: CRISPR-associated endonuclease Cas1 [Pseudomonas sp.]
MNPKAAGRLSLACDLMEPLRPAAEAWVVRLFTENKIDKRHLDNHSEITSIKTEAA